MPMDIRRTLAWALSAALLFVVAACSEDPLGIDSSDPCAPGEIVLGGSVNGSLSVDGCLRNGAPVGRWAFELLQEIDVKIDLTSSTMDPYLELQTTSGEVLAANDDFGSLNSTIITRLSPGRYVIQARDLRGGVGSYRLSLREGPDCAPLGELEMGRTEGGTLVDGDCLWEMGGLSDNWSLTLPGRANLRITAKSPDFDEVVLVRDPAGDIINGADEFGPLGFAQIDMRLEAGEWTISVGALTPGRTGAYDLTVDLTPPCTPGTQLVLGRTESGSLDATDCRFDGFAPADSFALVLDRETPLDFHLKSSEIRPFLVVRDANGVDVAYADNPSGAGSARTQTSLVAGAYAVYALTWDYPSTGSYQLTVSEVVCSDSTPIAFGASESGDLGDGDCLRSNGAWEDLWSLELAGEETVRIDMVSDDVDAYLTLEDSLGNVVTVDDDGGEGLNARIQATLPAGRYQIGASSFGPGQAGGYTLTVGAPPAPDSPSGVSADTSADGSVSKPGQFSSGDDWRERLEQLRTRLKPDWLPAHK